MKYRNVFTTEMFFSVLRYECMLMCVYVYVFLYSQNRYIKV